ncbi:MAG: heme-binding protein, partial [Thiohalocapsa sp.]
MPLFKLQYWILAGMLLPAVLIVLALVRPEGPDYEVRERNEGFELREYAPMRVAETQVTGDFAGADDAAFGLLLDYIRGDNSSGRKLPM